MIALSWSRVSDFQQCRRKFYLKHISKAFPYEDPNKSIHLVKGAEMHKQMENYTYAKLNGKPFEQAASPACKDAFPMIDRVFEQFGTVRPEWQVAVNADWKPDEWFSKQVAWRAIWDLSAWGHGVALLIDWKTGKIQDYDTGEPGQLHLSAAMAMDVLDVEEVTIFYAFLEHKVKRPEGGLKLTRKDDYPHIRAFFTKIFEAANAEKEWRPQINQYCGYCPATKSQCEFSKKP